MTPDREPTPAEAAGLHVNEWGEGDPLVALHPLALESTAFAGVAQELARLGLRTVALDLPGFGLSPLVEGPLTPAALAEPVLDFVRALERPPILMGMSLGGRVALEVALREPERVRGLVLVAPFLPWRTYSRFTRMARYLDPAWGEHLPLERIWPLLKRTTDLLEAIPALEHNWFARACVRVAYYLTCPATRTAFFSAARELALDPSEGEDGLWAKLGDLAVSTAFLWAGRDRLIPRSHADAVAEILPEAAQLEVACSGHFVNFLHCRCMEHGIALATSRILDAEEGRERTSQRILTPCIAHLDRDAARADPPTPPTSEDSGARDEDPALTRVG